MWDNTRGSRLGFIPHIAIAGGLHFFVTFAMFIWVGVLEKGLDSDRICVVGFSHDGMIMLEDQFSIGTATLNVIPSMATEWCKDLDEREVRL